MRNFRPRRSSTLRNSRRKKPPICAEVLPAASGTALYGSRNSAISSAPPPAYIQALRCRVFMPKGMPVKKAKPGSLPVK